jgi:hypothetical protein
MLWLNDQGKTGVLGPDDVSELLEIGRHVGSPD